MELSIDGKQLEPGKDFIVSAESREIKAEGELNKKDSITFLFPEKRLIIKIENKLTMSVAPEVQDYTAVKIDKKSLTKDPEHFKVNIENKFINDFKASNICGFVRGKVKPDSFIVISAH